MKKGSKDTLPWLLDSLITEDEPNSEKTPPTYDLNMRNYQKSVACRIKLIRQLRQNTDSGSTIEVTYDLIGTGLTYVTASNYALYPHNKKADVEQFAKMFDLNLDSTFKWKENPAYSGRAANTPFPIPSNGITYREALTKFIDLTGAISKKLLKEFIPLCEAQADKDK